MDKALVFGTKDCRFESCQGHPLHASSQGRPHVPRSVCVRVCACQLRRREIAGEEVRGGKWPLRSEREHPLRDSNPQSSD